MMKQLVFVQDGLWKSRLQPLTSLSKSLKLLLTLRENSEPMSLTEISRALGLNKVTTLRILVTMEQYRFVERDLEAKRYKIGCNAFYVGSGFIAGGQDEKVLQVMKKVVQELKKEFRDRGPKAVDAGGMRWLVEGKFLPRPLGNWGHGSSSGFFGTNQPPRNPSTTSPAG